MQHSILPQNAADFRSAYDVAFLINNDIFFYVAHQIYGAI